ncbi:MAG TPA: LAGLIDADG family homing endonuclease [Kofleriaceae bacterium]|nr:LAGLIDADG family homing endonuclease [Kofleriaceae bacterium]
MLARMWEGDGTISVRGRHLDYDTSSPRLADDVRHLLLRLGVLARVYTRRRLYRGQRLTSYVVTVTGYDNFVQFHRTIGRRFLGKKKRDLSRALQKPVGARMSKDVIPGEVSLEIRRARARRNVSWNEIGRATGLGMREVQSVSAAKRGFRRWVIDKLGRYLRSKALRVLANSEVYWDRIVSIEPIGIQETFDLSIEGNHNFLANDFVVHNSHAASFALIAYATCWMRKHYLPEFTASLLNAQPMGFYSPATIVGDAQRHHLEVRPIDVVHSKWDCTLEPADDDFGFAVRMGLRWIRGMQLAEGDRVIAARDARRFASLEDFVRRAGVSARTHDALAESGAFATLGGLGTGRRDALWQVAGWVVRKTDDLSLGDGYREPDLAPLTRLEEIFWDYRTTDHSVRGHPLAPLRPELASRGWPDAASIARGRDGAYTSYVGIVICRQQPGTASGVTFMTMEDETGFVNLVVWQQVFAQFSHVVRSTSLLGVTGRLQVQEGIVHLIADEVWVPKLSREVVTVASRDFH